MKDLLIHLKEVLQKENPHATRRYPDLTVRGLINAIEKAQEIKSMEKLNENQFITEKYIPFLIDKTMDKMEKEGKMPKDRKEWIEYFQEMEKMCQIKRLQHGHSKLCCITSN